MTLKALNFDYNTKPSIIYIACCAIVLMLHNALGMESVFYGFETLKIIL